MSFSFLSCRSYKPKTELKALNFLLLEDVKALMRLGLNENDPEKKEVYLTTARELEIQLTQAFEKEGLYLMAKRVQDDILEFSRTL